MEIRSPFRPWLGRGLAVYWGVLFIATHIPLAREISVPGGDKTIHFVSYGLLAMWLCSVWLIKAPAPTILSGITTGAVAWIITALYGAFDELTQPLVNRVCDLGDWYADIIGAAFGSLLVTGMCLLARRRRHTEPAPS